MRISRLVLRLHVSWIPATPSYLQNWQQATCFRRRWQTFSLVHFKQFHGTGNHLEV